MPLVPPLDASPPEVKAALEPLRHDFSVALHAAENPFAVAAFSPAATIIAACASVRV